MHIATMPLPSEQQTLQTQIKNKLKNQYNNNLYRSRLKFISSQGIKQKDKLNFSSNDYLGFANNSEIIKKVQDLLPSIGTGSGASSLITGYHHIHQDLEQLIANLLNCEQAILFPSGYMANLAIADVLLNLDNSNTIAIHDHNNHASILDGTKLAHCKLARYAHNNTEHLEKILTKYNYVNNKFIFTESLFSMDGDFADLENINNLFINHNLTPDNSVLIIDESHAFGLYNKNGQGLINNNKLIKNTLIMGTFGKAIGSAGAFVAGPKLFIEALVQFARPYIYTTHLSPIAAAASLYAIKLNYQNPSYREKLFDNINYFCNQLLSIGILPINHHSPIQPIIIGDNFVTVQAAQYLQKNNIIATAIRSPTVAINKARLRLTISAKHNKTDIDYLIKTLNNLKQDLSINLAGNISNNEHA